MPVKVSVIPNVHMSKLFPLSLERALSGFNLLKDRGRLRETTAALRDSAVTSDRCLDPLGRDTSSTASNKSRSLGTPVDDPERSGQLPEIGLPEPTPT